MRLILVNLLSKVNIRIFVYEFRKTKNININLRDWYL